MTYDSLYRDWDTQVGISEINIYNGTSSYFISCTNLRFVYFTFHNFINLFEHVDSNLCYI